MTSSHQTHCIYRHDEWTTARKYSDYNIRSRCLFKKIKLLNKVCWLKDKVIVHLSFYIKLYSPLSYTLSSHRTQCTGEIWKRKISFQNGILSKLVRSFVSPLNSNIRIRTLNSLLYIFPLVLTRRTSLTIEAS